LKVTFILVLDCLKHDKVELYLNLVMGKHILWQVTDQVKKKLTQTLNVSQNTNWTTPFNSNKKIKMGTHYGKVGEF